MKNSESSQREIADQLQRSKNQIDIRFPNSILRWKKTKESRFQNAEGKEFWTQNLYQNKPI